AAHYDIVSINGLTKGYSIVTTVVFPAQPAPATQTIEIPCPREGVYHLYALHEGKLLSEAEFRAGSYVVIDTKTPPPAVRNAKMTLVHDIDCVANTLDGAPVVSGTNYWEGNGPTRVNTSAAGKYRESNDGRGEGVEVDTQKPARNFSGFAYQVSMDNTSTPYLLEIDHPDDDWRSVCVSICDIYDAKAKKGFMPPGFGYETGGVYPISNAMQTERVIFWTNAKSVHLGLVSARIGRRVAAAHLRLYRIDGPLPSLGTPPQGGRFMGAWLEEKDRWHIQFNTPPGLLDIERDYIGIQRWAELMAYTGMNAIWPTEAAYQQTTYDSPVLKGYLIKGHDAVRITALMCEKYGLKYVPEIFLGKQGYFNANVMTAGAEHPQDLYDTTWWGMCPGTSGAQGGMWPTWNILHPQVQQKMIDIYGELADKVSDSPAFAGMSGRIDGWLWDGLYAITSVNWGYGDWTVAQFSKDTGVTVPGKAGDDGRFETRYRFLTAPDMKAKWIAWRAARVTDYLRRLHARISRNRKDLTLFLCGNGMIDENHQGMIPTEIRQRLLEMGIDLNTLANEAGIAIVPVGGYGRGKTFTYLADQRAYDAFLAPENKAVGRNRERAFAFGNYYTEWGAEFPLDKLGDPIKNAHYCGASDAVGVNNLERLSVVLADEDTMAIREGGYGYYYGQRDVRGRWLQEFSRLPRLPFTALEIARDPVAVWYRDVTDPLPGSGIEKGYYFYAVNREAYPVTITLTLTGAKSMTALVPGEPVAWLAPRLTLTLQPFQLRTFRTGNGAAITAADTRVPQERIDFVKARLTYAQNVADAVTTGVYVGSVSAEEKVAYLANLHVAWEAFQHAQYWRARTALALAPMMVVYEKLGSYPPAQVNTRFPGVLEYARTDRFDPPEEFVDAQTLFAQRAPDCAAKLLDSESYNPEWRFTKVVSSAQGVLEFDLPVPAKGQYRLSVGHVAGASGVMAVSLAGKSLAIPMVTREPGKPDRTDFPVVDLPAGTVRLSIRRPDAFGIYGIKLTPQLRTLSSPLWSVVGPFKSFWGNGLGRDGDKDEAVKKGMLTVYPPEIKLDLKSVYRDERDPAKGELRWAQTDRALGAHAENGVNFTFRTWSRGLDFCYAVTYITSPDERDAMLMIGTDWWAKAWVNGTLVNSALNEKDKAAMGCQYNRWKPIPTMIHLQKGINTLLVKNQGGSAWNWFTCYISDQPDLTFSPLR
ncbi:MAG TPA: hypothetical protein VGL77_19465, partial [Armatimonadota bacterium]